MRPAQQIELRRAAARKFLDFELARQIPRRNCDTKARSAIVESARVTR
jgi:hypothetical protein